MGVITPVSGAYRKQEDEDSSPSARGRETASTTNQLTQEAAEAGFGKHQFDQAALASFK